MTLAIRLPALGAIVILSAASGVMLGRSAIAEINPIYFSSPASTRFFADLVPQGARLGGLAGGIEWSEPETVWATNLNVDGGLACVECEARPFGGDAPVFVRAEALPALVRAVEYRPIARPTVETPTVEIERYISFPVTQEEAQEQRVAGGDLAAGDAAPTEAEAPGGA